MRAIAHEGCRNTVRVTALEANSKHRFRTSFLQFWRKVPESDAQSVHRKLNMGEKSAFAPVGTRTRESVAPGFSVGRSTNWTTPAPYA